MADINVNVVLPNPISVDVTSPTQALATNVSIPGPQGPAGIQGPSGAIGPSGLIGPSGARGPGSNINNLTPEFLYITGKDGVVVSSNGVDTIYISGNSGYFQSAVNTLTTNLENTGNNLYTLLTNFSGNLDANYATDLQLYNTGSTLDNKINSLSGWSASAINLQQTGENLYSLLINFSGNLDANYASDAQLFTTGSTLDTKINSLSGYVNIQDNSILLNLNSTGSILDNKINSLSGYSASIVNLVSTGSTLDSKINSLSGYSASINNLQSTGSNLYSMLIGFSGNLDVTYATDSQLATTGSTLDNKINSLSGYSASAVNLATTGANLYTLITNFSGNLDADFASQAEINSLSGYVNSQDISISNNLTSTGSTLDNKINSLSGSSASAVNLTSTGATLITNLFNTGSNLNTKIDNLSGYVNAQDNNISTNLYNTGSTLDIKINTLSGYTDSQDTSISNNLRTTGSTLDAKINDLSGYVNTQDNSISNNLISTGSTLNNKINSLSGAAVLKFDDQIIYGTKYFNENVYIHNLYVTGDEFIANVTNSYIESPYLLLNLTGGAIDGGIFFVTGSGFTGINDYGPIIGFDHSNKFKIGVARRSDDLSFLPDIASVQELRAYSGVANNTFSTITNLASTGSTLDNKINSLSGWSASAANLASTGSTLDSKINSLSGWSASAANLASTGSTLNNRINTLSGYINSTSSNIVFTTGNQIKSGRLAIGDTIVDESYAYTLSVQSNNNNTWLEILNHSGSNKGVFFGIQDNDFEQYNWQAGDIKFFTSEIFSNGIERLRIKNDGKVGIGTSAPSEKLEVAGNIIANNLVYNTGNQTISGVKSFAQDTTFGDSAQGDFLVISGNQFTVYGSGNFTSGLFVNGNAVLTGIDLSAYATVANLASTGSTLDSKINSLSGNLTSTYATISNLASTGSTLQTNINNLSGYINSSSSNIVFRTGDQTISGIKIFGANNNYSGAHVVIAGGSGNLASGNLATIGGGFCNYAAANCSTIGGGRCNFSIGINSTVGGGNKNCATQTSATIGGGICNLAIGDYSTIGGGIYNCATTNYANVGGGVCNLATASAANVGGGFCNCATATYANVGGGRCNLATANYTTIGGGRNNCATATYANVGGGYRNCATANFTTVGGGRNNCVLADYSYIIGGRCAVIQINHSGAAVLGDGENRAHNSFSAHSLTLDFKSGVYFAQPYIYSSGSGPIESLSPLLAPNLVYNTGNQTISGVKTFIGNTNISGNLNVTGNSNIRGTLDVTGLVVSGLGSSFILKSPNNQTSVSFDGTINGNAGALFSNWLYSSNVSSRADDNFDHYYGGGGTRSVRFIGGGAANVNRVILDSNGNFGVGSGISSVPSRFYVSGNSVLQGNLTVSGDINISGNYDLYSQIENTKKLAIAYAIAL